MVDSRWQIAIFLILLDQICKFLIKAYFPTLVVLNEKGVFGILPWWFLIFGIFGILWLAIKRSWFFQNWGFLLIVAGGVSNIIDRVFYGGVVDFINIGQLPVFNLADVMISLGVIFIIIGFVGKNKKTEKV